MSYTLDSLKRDAEAYGGEYERSLGTGARALHMFVLPTMRQALAFYEHLDSNIQADMFRCTFSQETIVGTFTDPVFVKVRSF